MKSIALRFGEHFSPECGTICAHEEIISKIGYVWYGKLGTSISIKTLADILKNDSSKILLISSGKAKRYWAYISDYSYEPPKDFEFPSYYANKINDISVWFKIKRFEEAPKDIMSYCTVYSSRQVLSEVSKHSMSPYFKIEYKEEK